MLNRTSQSSCHSCFLFMRSAILISTGTLATLTKNFRGISQSLQTYSDKRFHIRQRPLPFTYIPIHYSIIQPYVASAIDNITKHANKLIKQINWISQGKVISAVTVRQSSRWKRYRPTQTSVTTLGSSLKKSHYHWQLSKMWQWL